MCIHYSSFTIHHSLFFIGAQRLLLHHQDGVAGGGAEVVADVTSGADVGVDGGDA